MDKLQKDIGLLNKSIEHWERMRGDREGGDEPSGSNCPLCKKYFKTRGCGPCPLVPSLICTRLYVKAIITFHGFNLQPWKRAATAVIDAITIVRDGLVGKKENSANAGDLIKKVESAQKDAAGSQRVYKENENG